MLPRLGGGTALLGEVNSLGLVRRASTGMRDCDEGAADEGAADDGGDCSARAAFSAGVRLCVSV